jgi:hypothetical protein
MAILKTSTYQAMVVAMVVAVGKESRIKALNDVLDLPKDAVVIALIIAFLEESAPVARVRVTVSRAAVGESLTLNTTEVFAVELTDPTRSRFTKVEASDVAAFTDFAILKNFCIAKL